MTKFQPQYFIVCILTASMWASLGRSSNGDSVGELEREGAGIDQKVETPNLDNDNLRLKIDVFKETLTDLRTETNNIEDNLDEERDRPVQAAEDKSASIAEPLQDQQYQRRHPVQERWHHRRVSRKLHHLH